MRSQPTSTWTSSRDDDGESVTRRSRATTTRMVSRLVMAIVVVSGMAMVVNKNGSRHREGGANALRERLASGDIIGGWEVTDKTQYPFVTRSSSSKGSCTGSLLSQWYALSADHCFHGDGTAATVTIGTVNTNPSAVELASTAQRRTGRVVSLHPNEADKNGLAIHGGGRDMALIRLDNPFEIASNAKTIGLGSVTPNDGTRLLQMGFGLTGVNRVGTNILRAGHGSVTSCRDPYTDSICTFGGAIVDLGDSGGPLVQEVNGEFLVLGDCSYYYKIHPNGDFYSNESRVDVYVSVPVHLGWIRQEMNKVVSGGEYQVWIGSGLSSNQGRFMLSSWPAGNGLDLWKFDDNSGRQRFVFESAGNGGANDFNIRVSGGTPASNQYLACSSSGSVSLGSGSNKQAWTVTIGGYDGDVAYYLIKCSQDSKDLSTNFYGTYVGTWNDDNSGRQHWYLTRFDEQVRGSVNVGDYTYNIKTAVSSSGAKYLSAWSNGNGVDMWYSDDGSGRQEFQFEHISENKFGIYFKNGVCCNKKYLAAKSDGTGVFVATSSTSSTAQWEVIPQPQTDQVLIKVHGGVSNNKKYLRLVNANQRSVDLADSVTAKNGNTNWLISMKM